jgi:vanillate O-demethylase monooxygenase subunit
MPEPIDAVIAQASQDIPGGILSNTSPQLASYWHPVATATEVGDEPVKVMLLGEPWVLARINGELSAFRDLCPHRGSPLSRGMVGDLDGGGDCLRCPYHGWGYDQHGTCVDVPSQTTPLAPGTPSSLIKPAGLAEHLGLIWLAPEEPIAPLPQVADADDPEYDTVLVGPYRWDVGAGVMTDNFVSMAHVPWLHGGTFGNERPDIVVESDFDLTVDEDGCGFVNPLGPNVGFQERTATNDLTTVDLTMFYRRPLFINVLLHYQSTDDNQNILLISQPETERTTRLYTLLIRNDLRRPDRPEGIDPEDARDFQTKILEEDRWLLELVEPHGLDTDVTAKASCGADVPSIEIHRQLGLILAGPDAS